MDAVRNLTVTTINSTTVFISWSPPYTLKGVPILGYNVTTDSGIVDTLLVEDTSLFSTVDQSDPGGNITVTVVPLNRAGLGKAASVIIIKTMTSSPSPAVAQGIRNYSNYTA